MDPFRDFVSLFETCLVGMLCRYAFDENGEVVLVKPPTSTPSFGNLPKIEVANAAEEVRLKHDHPKQSEQPL